MLTFYDFIEEFLTQGVVLTSDKVKIPKDYRTSPEKPKYFQDQNQRFVSPPSNKNKIQAMIWESNHRLQNEKDVQHNPLLKDVKELNVDDICMITDLVERRCFDLCQQISFNFLTDANIQKEIAFLIFCIAREEAKIENSKISLERLKTLFEVQIRDKKLFDHFQIILSQVCPSNTMNFKFDLVFRVYDNMGNEILPLPLTKLVEANRTAMMKIIMDNPEYKEKMLKLGRIDPHMIATLGKQETNFLSRNSPRMMVELTRDTTLHQSPEEIVRFPIENKNSSRKRPERIKKLGNRQGSVENFNPNLQKNDNSEKINRQPFPLKPIAGVRIDKIFDRKKGSHNILIPYFPNQSNCQPTPVPYNSFLMEYNSNSAPLTKRNSIRVKKCQFIENFKAVPSPENIFYERKSYDINQNEVKYRKPVELRRSEKIRKIYKKSKEILGNRKIEKGQELKEKETPVLEILNRVIVILILVILVLLVWN